MVRNVKEPNVFKEFGLSLANIVENIAKSTPKGYDLVTKGLGCEVDFARPTKNSYSQK